MKVTFIYHSSYFVELDHCCLLFDYYQGNIPQVDKPLYVFASHSHGDHFSPAIFQLAQEGKEVHYLLSDDISPRQVPEELKDQVTFVAPRSFYEVGELKAGRHCAPLTWGWPSWYSARASAFTTPGI